MQSVGATKTSSVPLFSPFVNKEHLCGHSVDNLAPRFLRKCLFTIIVRMIIIVKMRSFIYAVVKVQVKLFDWMSLSVLILFVPSVSINAKYLYLIAGHLQG